MISESLKQLYIEENDIWGKPQTFKGINFYPIKTSQTKLKELLFRLFCIPKKYIQDIQIVKMSYLKFMIHAGFAASGMNQAEFLSELTLFLEEITKSENVVLAFNREDNPKDLREVKWHILLDSARISESDFDIIREIVLVQNGLSLRYIEDYNPQLEEKLSIKNKLSSLFTFKDQVFVLASFSNKTTVEIGEYTMYQFKHHLARVLAIQEYSLYRPLEASGQIKLDGGAKIANFYHLADVEGRYDSILINKDEFVKKSKFLNDSSIRQVSH